MPASKPATRPSHPAADALSLRLTRRGRLVLVALLAALAFALVSVGQAAVQAGEPDAGGVGDDAPVSATYVVQPGETLWTIAEQVDEDTDPRETVARIVAMNDLADSGVVVGQELRLPA